jgi:hypothetical protein
MVTTKRQLSFYAETDVDLYLSLVGPGSKTAILNDAIRSRIITDASVDLNDGRRPQPFAALSEHEMAEVHSNLILEELSQNNVDDHVWEIVRETANHSWKQNTARYLALHQAKFKEPFKIKRIRSQEERDEYMRNRPTAISSYYCFDHRTKNATALTGINMGELKCRDCGELAEYREYK